jgi:hypothetical protein
MFSSGGAACCYAVFALLSDWHKRLRMDIFSLTGGSMR